MNCAEPTRGGIVFGDIEALVVALGGQVFECEEARELFERVGIHP